MLSLSNHCCKACLCAYGVLGMVMLLQLLALDSNERGIYVCYQPGFLQKQVPGNLLGASEKIPVQQEEITENTIYWESLSKNILDCAALNGSPGTFFPFILLVEICLLFLHLEGCQLLPRPSSFNAQPLSRYLLIHHAYRLAIYMESIM